MAIMAVSKMSAHQIGYAVMTILIILAFLFQAVCFAFNNWYRMDVGPFMIRWGLWEMRIYDDKNVTGLDRRHHEKAEFRFYNDNWKSAMDKMEKMGKTAPPKKNKKATKPPRPGRDDDFDGDDPDYNEIEHFKPGENWLNLPAHIPDTVWDQSSSNLASAEALYSITWLATFVLMCLFAFHQFVPHFQITLVLMRLFCASLFVSGFFVIIAVSCYGNSMPAICKYITEVYENSPNPRFAAAARDSSDCSFSAGYSLAVFSGLFLIFTGVMVAIRICQMQRGEEFDLGSAAGAAVSFGKSFLKGGATPGAASSSVPPEQAGLTANWQQPGSAYSAGYDQDSYQATNAQGNWQRLE